MSGKWQCPKCHSGGTGFERMKVARSMRSWRSDEAMYHSRILMPATIPGEAIAWNCEGGTLVAVGTTCVGTPRTHRHLLTRDAGCRAREMGLSEPSGAQKIALKDSDARC